MDLFSTHFARCVSHKVVFPLNNADIQCAYTTCRSGLLCGACKEGYNLVLAMQQYLSYATLSLCRDGFSTGLLASCLQSYSGRRNNPASDLATLILFSYAKILRTLIAALYFTYLAYPKYNKGVYGCMMQTLTISAANIFHCLYSGSVCLLLSLLPYSILLLLGPCLQAVSHPRLFSLVINVKLKPFIDSYQAPYKEKHRY